MKQSKKHSAKHTVRHVAEPKAKAAPGQGSGNFLSRLLPWQRGLIIGALVVCLIASAVTVWYVTRRYAVSFYNEDGFMISKVMVPAGEMVTELPYSDGLWRDENGALVDPAAITISCSRTFHAWSTPALSRNHGKLISVESSRFFPDEAITRAQAAELIYALLADRAVHGHSADYSDVTAADGCYVAVRTLTAMEVVRGYNDGTFRPNEAMTRAEFVSILYLLSGVETEAVSSFSDVPEDYWAAHAIAFAARQGWISGYSNGKFRPEADITRAEAVSIAVRVRGNLPPREDVDVACSDTVVFVDVPQSHWAYYEIIDAAYTNELLDYILGQVDGMQPGFMFLGGKMCHVNADTLRLDRFQSGVQEIDGSLYYIPADGFFIQRFSQGLLELNGAMFYVTADDGPFLADDYYGYLYFGRDGRYTSGSDAVDEYVNNILSDIISNRSLSQDEKLYRAYCSIRDGGYTYGARYESGWERGSSGWTRFCARVMYEEKYGTCYYWASAFLYLAQRLGYQAYAVCGGVGTGNGLHAWVVIDWDDGQSYIFDVELEWAYIHNFYNVSYSTTNMYKQPLYATNVIYVFPGQTATYYGGGNYEVGEENDDDLFDLPEGGILEPIPTEGVPPVETTPVETSPVETTPVETTPVETTPVETTPVDPPPVETTPVETSPVESEQGGD